MDKPIHIISFNFNSGDIVATPGALELAEKGVNLMEYLVRHLTCDWGDLCATDKRQNDWALKNGERLFSSYNTPRGKLYIITEADRSATTFLLPSEY